MHQVVWYYSGGGELHFKRLSLIIVLLTLGGCKQSHKCELTCHAVTYKTLGNQQTPKNILQLIEVTIFKWPLPKCSRRSCGLTPNTCNICILDSKICLVKLCYCWVINWLLSTWPTDKMGQMWSSTGAFISGCTLLETKLEGVSIIYLKSCHEKGRTEWQKENPPSM